MFVCLTQPYISTAKSYVTKLVQLWSKFVLELNIFHQRQEGPVFPVSLFTCLKYHEQWCHRNTRENNIQWAIFKWFHIQPRGGIWCPPFPHPSFWNLYSLERKLVLSWSLFSFAFPPSPHLSLLRHTLSHIATTKSVHRGQIIESSAEISWSITVYLPPPVFHRISQ